MFRKAFNDIKLRVITGGMVLFPPLVTLVICLYILNKAESIVVTPTVNWLTDGQGLSMVSNPIISGLMKEGLFPLLGLIAAALVCYFVGVVTKNRLIKKWLSLVESGFASVPFVGSVFGPLRQVANQVQKTLDAKDFKRVVMIEYPTRGFWQTAFVTNEGVPEADEGKTVKTVFVPFGPIPTQGLVLVVEDPSHMIPLDITPQDAIASVVSLGFTTDDKKIALALEGRRRGVQS